MRIGRRRAFVPCFFVLIVWLALIPRSFCYQSLQRPTGSGWTSRREVFGSFLTAGGVMIAPSLSKATDATSFRPYAPLEALVPAARNRLLLTKCLALANELVNKQNASGDYESLETRLKQTIPPPISNLVSSISRKTPWRPTQLTGTSMRAAMNIYTANLRFADSYVLTASDTDKRSYIRQYNQLPNVKQVVAADLDLRDLYRNLVETKMDDAQAELYSDNLDAVELQSLLRQVDDTYRQWFALISEQDIQAAEKEALEDVSN